MSRRVRSMLVSGCAAVLAVIAVPAPAHAEDGYISEAEAQFIAAKDEGLGGILEQVADQIEGVEVRCTPSSAAADCTKSQSDDPLVPAKVLGDLVGLKLGAVNNFASASSKKGSARAASGLLSDSGIINTSPGAGDPALVELDLTEGALGPVTGLADPKLELGAVSSSISKASPSADAKRDYNIAGGKLTLTVAAIAQLNDALEGATGDTIEDFDGLGLSDFCAVLPADQRAECEARTEDQLEFTFPTAEKVLDDIEKSSGGVSISLDDGVITVDIQKLLEAQGLDINNLPPNTDIIPFIIEGLDGALARLLESVGKLPAAYLNDSAAKIGGNELAGSLLGAVIGPILDDLTDAISGAVGDLADQLPDSFASGLSQVLQLIVNVPNEVDTSLVSGSAAATAGEADLAEAVQSAAATADSESQTALRVVLLGGQGADLLLANTVVGPFDAQATPDDPTIPTDNGKQPPTQVLPNAGAPDGANWIGLAGLVSLLGGLTMLGRSGSFAPATAGFGRSANWMRSDGVNLADQIWTDYVLAAYDWVRITVFRR